MSEEPVASLVSDFFRTRAEHPFGDVQYVSGRTRAPFSKALLTAADNLLAKADRALTNGDPDRARHFVDRAAALNYDEHERTTPAAFAASMMLFTAVTDALERSREGDSRWLDAAVETLPSIDGWGQSEMRHTLLAPSCGGSRRKAGFLRTISTGIEWTRSTGSHDRDAAGSPAIGSGPSRSRATRSRSERFRAGWVSGFHHLFTTNRSRNSDATRACGVM